MKIKLEKIMRVDIRHGGIIEMGRSQYQNWVWISLRDEGGGVNPDTGEWYCQTHIGGLDRDAVNALKNACDEALKLLDPQKSKRRRK